MITSQFKSNNTLWINGHPIYTADLKLGEGAQQQSLQAKTMDLLTYLIRHSNRAVPREELLQEVWQDTVVGEHVLTNTIGKLRKAIRAINLDEETLETIPKKGYRLNVNDSSVTSIQSENSEHKNILNILGQSVTNTKPSKALITLTISTIIIVLLSLYIQQVIGNKQLKIQPDIANIKRVAVLPFENLTRGKQQADNSLDYFGDGIAEELIYSLSNINNLMISARGSSFEYKDSHMKIQVIGDKLNVDALVLGSIKRSDSDIRVNVELVDVKTGLQLWNQKYKKSLSNIFDLQYEITVEIAYSLARKLSSNNTNSTKSVDEFNAYDLYLLGLHYLNKRTESSIAKSIKMFNQAINEKPDYGLAYAGLATSYALSQNFGNMNAAKSYEHGAAAARNAVLMSPQLAQAHAASGLVLATAGKFKEAIIAYRKAISLNQNYADAYMWLGDSLEVIGEVKQALESYRKVQVLDPLNHLNLSNIARIHFWRGEYIQGIKSIDTALVLNPDSEILWREKSAWAIGYKKVEDGLNWIENSLSINSKSALNISLKARLLAHTDNISESIALHEKAHKLARENDVVNTYYFLMLLEQQRFDEANSYIQTSLSEISKLKEDVAFQMLSIRHLQIYYLLKTHKYEMAKDILLVLIDDKENLNISANLGLNIYRLMSITMRHLKNDKASSIYADKALKMAMLDLDRGRAHPSFLMKVAGIYIMKGKYKSAMEILERLNKKGWLYYSPFLFDMEFQFLPDDKELSRIKELVGLRRRSSTSVY